MRPHGNNRLIVLSVVLALICGSKENVVAQGSQVATQRSLDATRQTQLTNQELAALLNGLGERTGDLDRDGSGNVISVCLQGTNANNRALFLVSALDSLQKLMIKGRGRTETGEWTREFLTSAK
jgi:hypothetical protein